MQRYKKYVNLFTFTDVIAGRKTLFYAHLCLSKISCHCKGCCLDLAPRGFLGETFKVFKAINQGIFLS